MSKQEDSRRPEKTLETTRGIDNEVRISKKAEMKRKFDRNQKRITLWDIQPSSLTSLVHLMNISINKHCIWVTAWFCMKCLAVCTNITLCGLGIEFISFRWNGTLFFRSWPMELRTSYTLYPATISELETKGIDAWNYMKDNFIVNKSGILFCSIGNKTVTDLLLKLLQIYRAMKILTKKCINPLQTEKSNKRFQFRQRWKNLKKTFRMQWKSINTKIGKNVVQLKKKRTLLSRFLITARKLPKLDLKRSIEYYGFAAVPKSIFTPHGQLLHSLNKPKFLHAIQSTLKDEETNADEQI